MVTRRQVKLAYIKRLTAKKVWLLIRGRIRYAFGFCPACNSDAPEVEGCPICGGAWFAASKVQMQQRIDKSLWFRRFKTRMHMEGYGR